MLFFLRTRPPPMSSLFPYTTLFRSHDLADPPVESIVRVADAVQQVSAGVAHFDGSQPVAEVVVITGHVGDRKSTRLNSSHRCISYAVFCLKKKKKKKKNTKYDKATH